MLSAFTKTLVANLIQQGQHLGAIAYLAERYPDVAVNHMGSTVEVWVGHHRFWIPRSPERDPPLYLPKGHHGRRIDIEEFWEILEEELE